MTFEIGFHPIFGISVGVEYVPDTDDGTGESAFVLDLLLLRVMFFWGNEE